MTGFKDPLLAKNYVVYSRFRDDRLVTYGLICLKGFAYKIVKQMWVKVLMFLLAVFGLAPTLPKFLKDK